MDTSIEPSLPEGKLFISSGSVLRVYGPGESVPLVIDEEANYVMVDGEGNVLYTASGISSNHGMADSSYLQEDAGIVFGELSFNVPSGMKLYNLTDKGYKDFVNKASENPSLGSLVMDDTTSECAAWNSNENPYLSGKTFVFGEDSENVINPFAIRLSSVYDIMTKDFALYKMSAPYEDEYHFESEELDSITIYDEKMNEIAVGRKTVDCALFARDLVYVKVTGPKDAFFTMKVTLQDHLVELPYQALRGKDLSSYDLQGDPEVNPLEACELNVKKRQDSRSVYINCNNPERLNSGCMNTSLCNTDVTEKDVFFTFEHNNPNDITFYYGYRVTNKSDHDIFVMVKNLGLQIGGPGSWLGEDEWIKFYNLTFKTDVESLTPSQKSNFDAYLGFALNYQSENRQPITYRIPKGGYMYVMGGTTRDAYGNISVFDSADQKVIGGRDGCSNGAVLFSVRGGEALGQFVLYRDSNARNLNRSEYITEEKQYGYTTENGTGAQYAGWDDCHGVVDTQVEWTFNDSTPAGGLRVNYDNPYFTSHRNGENFTEIDSFQTITNSNAGQWVTHINPNSTQNAVGTDMTRYITTDHETEEPIVLDYLHYDGRGSIVNIGNWMVDYQDTITLINQGDRARTVTYRLRHHGTILSYVLDENGDLVEGYEPKYHVIIATSSYGDAIDQPCSYTVTVPAHSVVRFTLGYNLLANSNGHISHTASLE